MIEDKIVEDKKKLITLINDIKMNKIIYFQKLLKPFYKGKNFLMIINLLKHKTSINLYFFNLY